MSSSASSSVSRCGVAPGNRWKSVSGMCRVPRVLFTSTVASSAASATAMSDGWVATQWSLVPSTALPRLNPSSAAQPGAGLALVARRRLVVEVEAAGALHQVAPDRRHVPQLPGGAVQDRLRQNRIPGADQGVRGQATVAHQRADPQPAVGEFLDPVQRQPGDVDDRLRPLDALAHQVDEVGAAGEELRSRLGSDRPQGGVHVRSADVGEALHPRPPGSRRRCRCTRRTGTGCRSSAPGSRQGSTRRRSRPDARSRRWARPPRCSASIPIAEQIWPGVQ